MFIEVRCPNRAHADCVLKRSLDAASARPRAGQGRCLGMCAAFILSANSVSSKDEHKRLLPFSFEDRQSGREELRRAYGSHVLFECERAPEGSEDEPVAIR